MFNQDFIFPLPNLKRMEDMLSGKFVVFTVYAILDGQNNDIENYKTNRNSSTSFRNFFSKVGDVKRTESTRTRERVSLYRRRTVGAVTYNLDARGFTQKLRFNMVGTPDIWRNIKSISSGYVDKEKTVRNKNIGSIHYYSLHILYTVVLGRVTNFSRYDQIS